MVHDLTLGRISLRAPGDQARVAQARQLNHLNAALYHADLAPSGFPPQAVLIVRRLADPAPGKLLQGTPWQAGQSWGEEACAQITAQWRAAVRPYTQSVPATANAVWFVDQAEWLACLTADLFSGVAARNWWWDAALSRTHIRNAASPIAMLWQQYAASVPPALTLLHSRRDFEVMDLIRHLPTHSLNGIRRQILIAYELPPSAADVMIPAQIAAQLPTADRYRADLMSDAAQTWALILGLVWRPVLIRQGLTSGTSEEVDPSTGILGQSQRAARAAPNGTSLQSGRHQSSSQESSAAEPPAAGPPHSSTVEPASAEFADLTASGPSDRRISVSAGADTDEKRERRDPGKRDDALERDESSSVEASHVRSDYRTGGDAELPAARPGAVQTTLGGIWFLTNVLILMELLDNRYILWAQLDALGRLLLGDQAPDDNIWSVLEDLATSAGVDSLPDDSTLTWARDVLPAMQRWLQNRPGSLTDFSSILRRNATIHLSMERVDVLYSLEEIDFDCRIAGLDRDPGWLPELPRTIRFHFI